MKFLITIIGMFTMFTCYAHESMVLIADPRVLAIPVHENNDPLIDLVEHTEISFGPSPEIPNNTNYTKMRKSVYEKLVLAQSLLPQGLKIRLYEGYRSLELQEMLFQNVYEKIKKSHPELTHEAIFKETTKFVSPVTNLDGSKNIPPHGTGAAIDVYLIDEQGKPVDMGLLVENSLKDPNGELTRTESTVISKDAKEYRDIMSKALTAAGFVNYPSEYWHWSYGDRYWAYQTQQKNAYYDVISKKT